MGDSGVAALEALLERAQQTGEYSELLSALRLDWPRLAPESGEGLRGIFDSIPNDLWHNDPWLVTGYAGTHRSLGSASRSAALPYLAAARGLVSDSTLPAMDAGIEVHRAAALRSLGRFAEAIDVLEAAMARTAADTTMPLSWRIPLNAKLNLQAGIANFHLGDYDRARRQLRLAQGLASDHLHAWERVECFGALALVEYSGGNFDASLKLAQKARDAAAGTQLLRSRFGASALIAELLIAVERNRKDLAAELAPVVAAASVRSDWTPLGSYARAAISIISGQYVEGLELLRECLQAYREWQPKGSIVTVSEGLRATLLLRLGQTEAAWDILAVLQPTQHHSNCPGRFIAHLRLITGDPNGALAALHDCDLLGDTHSSRTLIDVLLLKAATHYELGTPEKGEVALDRALRLAARTQVRVPFRLVPDKIMQVMLSSAATRTHPEEVLEMISEVRGSAPHLWETMRLSEREREVVRSIATGRTANEIADDLFISVNTVKSHLKSVYRKLGVTSRGAAISRARELGLHVEKITPD